MVGEARIGAVVLVVLLVLVGVVVEELTGTCWKARVTSCRDIREGPEVGGWDVNPSSTFISGGVKGTGSSMIPSNEFIVRRPTLSGFCDQTAFKCSGSGRRTGDSLTGRFNDARVQGECRMGGIWS